VALFVLMLKGETFDAMIGCWGDLQAREQRKARK
jgi:hypothetical protein